MATGSARLTRGPKMVFAVAAMAGTMAVAPAAGATPKCVEITPTTTQCETPGHSQIITSPPAMNDIPQWWPYSGFAIGAPW